VDISPTELLIALAVALLVLGPAKVPRLARSLGEAIHELKHAAARGDEAISAPTPHEIPSE
jgi:TatA/E family protein of Tat protein translocase